MRRPLRALRRGVPLRRSGGLAGKTPTLHRWTFSTNGVSIAGMFGIPCVGFGPAPENVAHTVNDSVPIQHLVDCAAFYAAYGQAYCDLAAGRPHKIPMNFKRRKG